MYVSSIALHSVPYIPGQVLIEISSTAIWDWNKVVTAIATGLWATNAVAMIQGKFSSNK